MPLEKIIAKTIFRDTGISKSSGKQWHKWKIISITDDEYTTFHLSKDKEQSKFMDKQLMEGSLVILESTPSAYANKHDILEIRSIQPPSANPAPKNNVNKGNTVLHGEEPNASANALIGGYTLDQLGLSNPNTGQIMINRVEAVRNIVAKIYNGKVEDIDIKDGLVIELLGQMRSINWQNKV